MMVIQLGRLISFLAMIPTDFILFDMKKLWNPVVKNLNSS
jgi:hypothetical protein